MRGKVVFAAEFLQLVGITPAYAGKSHILTTETVPAVGSPPPMRGKAPAAGWTELSIRITPAYAGKRRNHEFEPRRIEDHPRLCGEKFAFWSITTQAKGSPPPMRGKVLRMLEKSPQKRITPAYAGKSNSKMIRYFRNQDHPRLCGEKSQKNRRSPFYKGSPPPMRGKDFADHGQTLGIWDHPRLCGEKRQVRGEEKR